MVKQLSVIAAPNHAFFQESIGPRKYNVGHGSSRTRVLTGLLVHQQRRALMADPSFCSVDQGTRFASLNPICDTLNFLRSNTKPVSGD